MSPKPEKGILVALAWPETYAFSAGGKWYEFIYEITKVNENKRYKLGHAGQLLISAQTGKIEYYDFGRYTTPEGKGRTRGAITDPELEVTMKAQFNENGEWVNIEEVLKHIESRGEDTHGEGPMFASICDRIDYHKCKDFILRMIDTGSMTYDPFKSGATNCSRFVASSLMSATLDLSAKGKLKMLVLGAATPTSNLYNAKVNPEIYETFEGDVRRVTFNRLKSAWKFIRNMLAKEAKKTPEQFEEIHYGTQIEPTRPDHLPDGAQWLPGIGSGHWHVLESNTEKHGYFVISRYAYTGRKDFTAIFRIDKSGFDSSLPFKFVYDCSAYRCTVRQKSELFIFDFEKMLEQVPVP